MPTIVVVLTRFLCAAVLVAVAASSGALENARGYNVSGRPWPGGVVRYYNAAPDQAWAVQRAVDAWNSSGAALRFVAVPASQAQLRIEHFPRIRCTINAEATVGYARAARVYIFRRDDRSLYCNAYGAATALAHEFGHVLGLDHQQRGCALMNPVYTLQGPALCPKAKDWQWRCRLLTSDDVAGAVALYGGVVRPQTGPRDCDLYRGMHAPMELKIASTTVPHDYQITFRRPASVAVPVFLASRRWEPESFVAGITTGGRCATDPHLYARREWRATPGALQSMDVLLEPGTYCLAVWGVDLFGRPSVRPAQLRIRIA